MADTHYADSAELADVQAAVDAASSGDTVIVPADAATWTAPLSINKGLVIQGNGIGNTVTTWNGGEDNAIIYSPASPALNEVLRFTGFTLNGADVAGSVGFFIHNTSNTSTLSKIRIDHCRVVNFTEAYEFYGMIYGLVDHCQLDGNNLDFRFEGQDAYSWNDPLQVGSANYLYVEDCTISDTADESTLAGYGARYVLRYNSWDLAGCDYNIFECHGNLGNASGPYAIEHGTVGVEIYENTLTNCGVFRLHDHRGGTLVMFNNIGTGGSGGGNFPIVLREEDNDTGIGPGYPLKTDWPGYDPIKDSYIWGNKINGDPLHLNVEDYGVMLIEKTDYWSDLQHNSDSYTTYWSSGLFANRPASPADDDCYWATDTRVLYRSVGANNWVEIYTPYTYPHPLQGLANEGKFVMVFK